MAGEVKWTRRSKTKAFEDQVDVHRRDRRKLNFSRIVEEESRKWSSIEDEGEEFGRESMK